MPLKVIKRKNSPYWQITGTLAGQRIRKSTGTTLKQDAEQEAARIQSEAWKRRQFGDEAVATFAQAYNLYMDEGGEERFGPPLLEYFQTTPLRDITPGDVRAAALALYPKASAATRNRQAITPARSIINCGHQHGLCPPIRVKHFKVTKTPKKAVNREYIDKLMAACTSRYLAALSLFIHQSGARISEAVSVRPEDMDLQNRRVVCGKTKNGEPHVIILTVEMTVMLANLPPRNGRAFGYKSRHAVYGPLKTACKRAGIEYLATHQPGRHSFYTEMIVRHRVDLATAAERGNSKSTRLLAETYLHPGDPESVIDEVFGAKQAHSKTAKASK